MYLIKVPKSKIFWSYMSQRLYKDLILITPPPPPPKKKLTPSINTMIKIIKLE